MWEYSDKVKEHFLHPRNVGEIENPDAVGEVGSMSCGDALKLTLTVDEDERIVDARFKTFGCASAIASSSALTEMLKGKTIAEAEKITNDDIVAYLGGLPKEKIHCSVMGQDALTHAIACYRGETVEEKPGNVVCECFGVTDLEIRSALAGHDLPTVEEVTNFIKAGGGCGKCHDQIEALIAESRGEAPAPAAEAPAASAPMTNLQKMHRIEEVLTADIAPAIQKDGGRIELLDVDGDVVKVRLAGACATCAAAQMTLKDFVEKTLREKVKPELTVKEVRG
jgi:NifU-like protein